MKTVAQHLQSAATSLKKERPGMSMRAVAKRLNVSPSYWSKILRGERALSQQLLPRVVKVLGMDVQQMAELQRRILQEIENQQLAPATGIKTQTEKTSPTSGYVHLGQPDFWLLEEWFHIPILNAFTLSAAQNIETIAQNLKIKPYPVEESVQKSVAAGFLKYNEQGKLERTDLQIRFPTNRSHPQVRAHHANMIDRAHQEIAGKNASENFDRRLISSVNFAGSEANIQAAKLILEEAMYRAANLLAGEENRDTVYQLNVQLFPLTGDK